MPAGLRASTAAMLLEQPPSPGGSAEMVPASRPPPRDLEGVLLWIAEHDGRIDAWWDAQHRWNAAFEKRVDLELRELDRRLTALERRVIYWSGAAAAVGSIAGALLVRV